MNTGVHVHAHVHGPIPVSNPCPYVPISLAQSTLHVPLCGNRRIKIYRSTIRHPIASESIGHTGGGERRPDPRVRNAFEGEMHARKHKATRKLRFYTHRFCRMPAPTLSSRHSRLPSLPTSSSSSTSSSAITAFGLRLTTVRSICPVASLPVSMAPSAVQSAPISPGSCSHRSTTALVGTATRLGANIPPSTRRSIHLCHSPHLEGC